MEIVTKQNIKPGYKKTPLGIIPEEWEVKKLISQAYVDKENISSDFEDEFINYVSLSDIKNGKILPKKIEFKSAPSRAKRITKKGDVLLATVRPNLKNFAIVDKENIIASTGFAVLSYKKLDLVYLYNFLYSHQAEKQYFALTVGSNYPALNSNDVKNLKLPIPPKPEQKSIANCLSTWDLGIEKLTQLIQAKKQQKKGLMQQLFNGQLTMNNGQLERVENKEDWLKGWEEMRLEEIGEVINGLTYSPNDIRAKGTLVLRSSNIQNGTLSFKDNVYVDITDLKFNPVKEKDILICVRNGSKSLIGKNALITNDVKGEAFGAFMSIYRSDLNDYVFQFFKTDQYQRQIEQNLGATINSINNSELRKLKILLPPKNERIAIAKILQSADQEIELLEQKLSALQEQKKGLMQVLLTGEKRLIDE